MDTHLYNEFTPLIQRILSAFRDSKKQTAHQNVFVGVDTDTGKIYKSDSCLQSRRPKLSFGGIIVIFDLGYQEHTIREEDLVATVTDNSLILLHNRFGPLRKDQIWEQVTQRKLTYDQIKQLQRAYGEFHRGAQLIMPKEISAIVVEQAVPQPGYNVKGHDQTTRPVVPAKARAAGAHLV